MAYKKIHTTLTCYHTGYHFGQDFQAMGCRNIKRDAGRILPGG